METNFPRYRRVGILGGMGPAAALDLQAKILALTPATRDEDHLPVVTWNVPQIPDRVAAIEGRGPSPLPAIAEGARSLEAAGAEAIAIACNTAHHWAEELRSLMRVPLLHIVDAVAEAIAARPARPARIGLMGTRGTLASGFYGRRLEALGFAWIAPDEACQAAFIDPAIAAVKRADRTGAVEHFSGAARDLRERGADLLLLGCTELPLALAGSGFETCSLDANHALAQSVVRFALGPGRES
ncbi:MAG: amino acid racemase [Betaproteobacteria bacterium]|nr:amino acid racemase [Betaproteobacteria bacterium]